MADFTIVAEVSWGEAALTVAKYAALGVAGALVIRFYPPQRDPTYEYLFPSNPLLRSGDEATTTTQVITKTVTKTATITTAPDHIKLAKEFSKELRPVYNGHYSSLYTQFLSFKNQIQFLLNIQFGANLVVAVATISIIFCILWYFSAESKKRHGQLMERTEQVMEQNERLKEQNERLKVQNETPMERYEPLMQLLARFLDSHPANTSISTNNNDLDSTTEGDAANVPVNNGEELVGDDQLADSEDLALVVVAENVARVEQPIADGGPVENEETEPVNNEGRAEEQEPVNEEMPVAEAETPPNIGAMVNDREAVDDGAGSAGASVNGEVSTSGEAPTDVEESTDGGKSLDDEKSVDGEDSLDIREAGVIEKHEEGKVEEHDEDEIMPPPAPSIQEELLVAEPSISETTTVPPPDVKTTKETAGDKGKFVCLETSVNTEKPVDAKAFLSKESTGQEVPTTKMKPTSSERPMLSAQLEESKALKGAPTMLDGYFKSYYNHPDPAKMLMSIIEPYKAFLNKPKGFMLYIEVNLGEHGKQELMAELKKTEEWAGTWKSDSVNRKRPEILRDLLKKRLAAHVMLLQKQVNAAAFASYETDAHTKKDLFEVKLAPNIGNEAERLSEGLDSLKASIPYCREDEYRQKVDDHRRQLNEALETARSFSASAGHDTRANSKEPDKKASVSGLGHSKHASEETPTTLGSRGVANDHKKAAKDTETEGMEVPEDKPTSSSVPDVGQVPEKDANFRSSTTNASTTERTQAPPKKAMTATIEQDNSDDND